MNQSVILHVNAVEQGQSIDDMCRLAVAWGYDGIEFRRARRGRDETQAQYLEAIARARDAYGLKHVMFGGPGPNLMNPDAAVRKSEVEENIAFYKAAAKLFDLKVCNTFTGTLTAPDIHYYEFDKHGSACAKPEHWDWAVEGFRELGDVAGELGLRLAFETHNCFLHDLAKPARELVERIDRPSVGINLDYGNIILNLNGESLEESVKICAPYLFEVHLKNLYKLPVHQYYNFISCPMADGAINNRLFARLLKEMNYDGPVVLEMPREGDREWFAQEDLAYWQSLLRYLNI